MRLINAKKRRILIGVVLALVFLMVTATTAEDTAVNLVPQETNDVIIVLKDTPDTTAIHTTLAVREDIREQQQGVINDILDQPDVEREDVKTFETINAIAATVSDEILEELRDHPSVAAIIPDIKMSLFLEDSIPLINADDVHATSVPGTNGTNITGTGAGVCVIDTGIDPTHPDLQNNIVAQYCYCDNDGPCCGNNQTELFGNATDENGHGTHVSGIVAANAPAAGNSNNLVGVGKTASIVAVKVFGKDRSTYLSNILKGVDFCIANKNNYSISVITMSLGTGLFANATDCDANPTTLAFTDAANTATENNILMVAASGNSGATTGISLPACLSNVTAVGSTTKTDDVSAFTNRNSILDVFAPGSSINSTAQRNCPADGIGQVCSDTRYTILSGTSMATPHVAGLIAVADQYSRLFQNRSLRVDELRVLLRNTGKKIADAATTLTFPRINAEEFIDTIREPVKYSAFKNSFTTNFSALTLEQLEQVANARIGASDGSVTYTTLNGVAMNLNDSVAITAGNVALNVSKEPRLNASAGVTITINNPSVLHGTILDDGQKCVACVVTNSTVDNITFTASSLDSYANFTLAPSAQLNLFDDGDAQRGSKTIRVEDEAAFFANYTTDEGAPLANATCVITLNGTGTTMVYNPATTWHEYTTRFVAAETIAWNVSCNTTNHTPLRTPLAALDTVTIAPFIFSCKEYTLSNKKYVMNAMLEENITNATGICITLAADNITLDCAGNTIKNKIITASERTGIALKNSRNAVITNCTVANFPTSVRFDNATGAVIRDTQTDGGMVITGAGGFNDIVNTTYTGRTVFGNTTTRVQPSWRMTFVTTDNNSAVLGTNITLTNRNGTIQTVNNNAGTATLLLSEGIYGGSEEIHTPHQLAIAAGTYTTNETTINTSQTRSARLVFALSQLPARASFDGNTTDFTLVATSALANITSITLEKSVNGSVTFFTGRDVRGRNFDRAVLIGQPLVMVNTTSLGNDYSNSTGRVVLKGISCPAVIVASEGAFPSPESVRATGAACNENSSIACTNITCGDGALSFNVNHFSSFTVTPNAALTLTSNAPKQPNENVTLQLNYRNASSSESISDAVCVLNVGNASVIPAYNSATQRYEHQTSFAFAGMHSYNATCDSVSFTKLSAENLVNISVNASNTSNNSGNGGSGNGGSGSSGGSSGGGGGSGGSGGGGGGGGAPATPRTTTPTATSSAPATVSSISTPESSSPDTPAPARESSTTEPAERVAETGTAPSVTGAASKDPDTSGTNEGEDSASPLTGRIAGIGKTLKLMKEDGEFSAFGLIAIIGFLTTLALGLGNYSYQRVTHLDKEAAAHLKTSLGSFGVASDVMSAAREKTAALMNSIRQKLPARKRYLFEEKQEEKKFEF